MKQGRDGLRLEEGGREGRKKEGRNVKKEASEIKRKELRKVAESDKPPGINQQEAA